MLSPNLRSTVVMALALCVALPAFGHAILLSATPGASQQVDGRDVPIHLRFNARIDAKRSRLVLVGPDDRQQTLPISESSPPDYLSSAVKGLASGNYVLRWQVLAADGHITRGEVRFHVHE